MNKILVFLIIAASVTAFSNQSFSQVLDAAPRDGVYDKTAIAQVQPIAYPNLREADIVWSKRIWRVIDLREKMNQPFYFPTEPQRNWHSLAQILWDAVQEGTITAYNTENDQFLVPMTSKEVKAKVETADSTLQPDPDNEDQMIYVKNTQDFSSADIKKIRIKEDYYFDKQRSVFEVRILGICLVAPLMVKGQKFGDMELFWVYFPECRNLFSKHEIFNLKNGAAGRMTYDDVFMKRMFSSYIYKEENVYDRKISEYTSNVDALLEAEKAKSKLFEFESSLWEY